MKQIANKFCNECQDLYENWVICKTVFEYLPDNAELSKCDVLESRLGQCIARVYRMCYEAWVFQIVRLDDPKKQGKNHNMSIDYFLNMDDWTNDERKEIDKFRERLKTLPKHLRPARDKILAHNDLTTWVDNTKLGCFLEGEDKKYFIALAELATIVWRKWCATEAPPLEKNRVFVFTLDSLEHDENSAVHQATILHDCLCKGLHEDIKAWQ